jgi:hypothetical protein
MGPVVLHSDWGDGGRGVGERTGTWPSSDVGRRGSWALSACTCRLARFCIVILLGVGDAVESVSDSTEPDSREIGICVFWRESGGEAGTREGDAGEPRVTTGAGRSLGSVL